LHACVHRFPAGADIGLDGILRMFARLVQRNSLSTNRAGFTLPG